MRRLFGGILFPIKISKNSQYWQPKAPTIFNLTLQFLHFLKLLKYICYNSAKSRQLYF
jgi:hypothetical protein